MLWSLFLLFIFFPSILPAQTYPSRHYTMRDGLPSMGIRCIFKDSRGLMWIGTDAGLCTFDGKSFRIFKASEGMTASQVWAVTEDESGNMWFGSFGEGIFKYDGRTFTQFTTENGLVENVIRVMAWSKKYDCLVAAGYEGISVISGDSVKSVLAGELGPRNFRYAFTEVIDAGDFLYVTNYHANTLFRFYPDKMEGKIVNATGTIYPAYSFSGLIKSDGDTVFTAICNLSDNLCSAVCKISKFRVIQSSTFLIVRYNETGTALL